MKGGGAMAGEDFSDREGQSEEESAADLVRQAKKGSQPAFLELYAMYYKELYAYACYMLGHRQDAEDVVSDTIVAAYEGIGKLRDVYRFRQWIFKILSNQCKRRRRGYADRNKYMNHAPWDREGEEAHFCQVSDGSDMAEQAVQKQWIQEAFETLSEEERYIVNSFLFGGYKGEEIANSLGIGPSTLRSKYRRALKKMKKILEG